MSADAPAQAVENTVYAFAVDEQVRIEGLQTASSHNGSTARIVAPRGERWVVCLPGGEQLAVRGRNLVRAAEPLVLSGASVERTEVPMRVLAGILIFAGERSGRWLYRAAQPFPEGAVPLVFCIDNSGSMGETRELREVTERIVGVITCESPAAGIVALPCAAGLTAIVSTAELIAELISTLHLPSHTLVCYITDGFENCCHDPALTVDAAGTTVDMARLCASAQSGGFQNAAAREYQMHALSHLRFARGYAVLLLGVGRAKHMHQLLDVASAHGMTTAICTGPENEMQIDALCETLYDRGRAAPDAAIAAPLRVTDPLVQARVASMPEHRMRALRAVRPPARSSTLRLEEITPAVALVVATHIGTLSGLRQRFAVAERVVQNQFAQTLDEVDWMKIRGVVCCMLLQSHLCGCSIPSAPFVGTYSALKHLKTTCNKLLHQLSQSQGVLADAQRLGLETDELLEVAVVCSGNRTGPVGTTVLQLVAEDGSFVPVDVSPQTALYSLATSCPVDVLRDFASDATLVTCFVVGELRGRRRGRDERDADRNVAARRE
jgi:hypothetical protein